MPLPQGQLRFSIVMPLYNKARHVRCAVQSVLAQRLADFELLVVDDGSTDGSLAQLADLDDPRMTVVQQANAGVSVARNRGIALARGRWVVFLDADDWQHPDFLATLAEAQQRHPEVSVIGTRYFDLDGDGVPRVEAPGPLQIEMIDDLPRRWRRGTSFFTSSVAVEAALLKSMQPCFAPGESFGEDLDLWFRLAERSPVALVQSALAAHRVGQADSLTQAHARHGPPAFLARMRERAQSGRMPAAKRRSALRLVAHMHIDQARSALASGQRARSMRWIAQARHGASSRRWWVTLFMAACCPQALLPGLMAVLQSAKPAARHAGPERQAEAPAGAGGWRLWELPRGGLRSPGG